MLNKVAVQSQIKSKEAERVDERKGYFDEGVKLRQEVCHELSRARR